jgi:hypothetical protein
MSVKITKLDSHQVKEIRKQVNAGLVELGERLGLKINAGNASYSNNEITFKLACTIEGFNPDKEDFETYCYMFDLKPSDYGKPFRANGRSFLLVGIKPNRPKYPIIGEDSGGKRFKFQERVVAQMVAATA